MFAGRPRGPAQRPLSGISSVVRAGQVHALPGAGGAQAGAYLSDHGRRVFTRMAVIWTGSRPKSFRDFTQKLFCRPLG